MPPSSTHTNVGRPNSPSPQLLQSSLKKRKSTAAGTKQQRKISFQIRDSSGKNNSFNSPKSEANSGVPPPAHFSIVTLNTHSFANKDYQSHFQALVKFLRHTKPDVIALQQCLHVSGKNSGSNLVKSLAQKLNYFYVFGDTFRLSFGNVILSKYKMLDSANCQIMDDHTIRAMLRVRLRVPLSQRETSRRDLTNSEHQKRLQKNDALTTRPATPPIGIGGGRGSPLLSHGSADNTSSPKNSPSLSTSSERNFYEIDIYTTDLSKGRQQAVPQLKQMLDQMVFVQSSSTPHIICGDFDSLCLDDYSVDYLNQMKERWRQKKVHGAQFDAHFLMEKLGYTDIFKECHQDSWSEHQDTNCATGTMGRIPVRTDFIFMDELMRAEQPTGGPVLTLKECNHLSVEGLDRKVVLAIFEICTNNTAE
mmetsp:Transcript_9672/g.35887  ORF Transcript_9672/g.35887 Transcript_9672/m.35887 type:complete len:420 (+) Transcript_9672:38-1297(+)